jgi:hypothetical protein
MGKTALKTAYFLEMPLYQYIYIIITKHTHTTPYNRVLGAVSNSLKHMVFSCGIIVSGRKPASGNLDHVSHNGPATSGNG